MSRWIDADALIEAMGEEPYVWTDSAEEIAERNQWLTDMGVIESAPSIDIVRCRECKHRPIKADADGKNYGFNLIEPNDGDGRCPCLVSDGWYSWMPEDDFYCGYGERKESE